MFKITGIPARQDNYIWVIHNDEQAVIVDPGEAAPVFDFLAQHKLPLTAILCTHRHHDHVDGIAKLRAVYNVPVYGRSHAKNPHITHDLKDGAKLTLAGLEIEFDIFETPGHLEDHIVYFASEPGILFCGDIIFGAGCGKNFEGTAAELYGSLQRLAQLPEDTLIYSAHEYTEFNLRFARRCDPDNPALLARIEATGRLRDQNLPTVPFSLATELATNPFIRCNDANIVRTLQARGLQDTSGLSVFLALIKWHSGN